MGGMPSEDIYKEFSPDVGARLRFQMALLVDLCSSAGPLYQKAVFNSLKQTLSDLPQWAINPDPEKQKPRLPEQWLPSSIEHRLRVSMAGMKMLYLECGSHYRDSIMSRLRQEIMELSGESKPKGIPEAKPRKPKYAAVQ